MSLPLSGLTSNLQSGIPAGNPTALAIMALPQQFANSLGPLQASTGQQAQAAPQNFTANLGLGGLMDMSQPLATSSPMAAIPQSASTPFNAASLMSPSAFQTSSPFTGTLPSISPLSATSPLTMPTSTPMASQAAPVATDSSQSLDSQLMPMVMGLASTLLQQVMQNNGSNLPQQNELVTSTPSSAKGTPYKGENDPKGEWGKTKAFNDKVASIAKDVGANKDDLMAVMKIESGLRGNAKNPKSSATGLIQWMKMPNGKSREEFSKMSELEQLDYVKQWFGKHKGNLNSPGKAYLAVAAPGVLDKLPKNADKDYVVYKAGSKEAKANPLWQDKKGNVTLGKLDELVRNQKKASGK